MNLGTHVICDLFGASNLGDCDFVESVLEECTLVAGAQLLLKNTHIFEPHGGVSSTFILMESHISIHTWPELQRAGFDAFMCGKATPINCIPVLEKAFRPRKLQTQELSRCGPRPAGQIHGTGIEGLQHHAD